MKMPLKMVEIHMDWTKCQPEDIMMGKETKHEQ